MGGGRGRDGGEREGGMRVGGEREGGTSERGIVLGILALLEELYLRKLVALVA